MAAALFRLLTYRLDYFSTAPCSSPVGRESGYPQVILSSIPELRPAPRIAHGVITALENLDDVEMFYGAAANSMIKLAAELDKS